MANARWPYDIECIDDAEGAADFAGMDGKAKARVAGNVEGPRVIGNAAHALLAGEIEA
jgi:hypothetical protein